MDCQQPVNPREAHNCASCGSELILYQRYRAIKLIGQGGFGRTFLAIDESHQSYCVIKQFFPQQQGNRHKASELFRQEAERLKTLGNHGQIPKLLDHFEDEQTLEPSLGEKHTYGNRYLIQEFIDGRNLAQELAEEGVFDAVKIRQLLENLLPVLDFIHSHDVIHRDIKPENIVRRYSKGKEELVLVDFESQYRAYVIHKHIKLSLYF
jgi:Ca-activated chloride channel family protein